MVFDDGERHPYIEGPKVHKRRTVCQTWGTPPAGAKISTSDAPPDDPKATIEELPVLNISRQYEMWARADLPLDEHWKWLRGGLLELRGHYERALVSELVDPGGCHFSFSEPLANYVALFIRKAAEARLPVAASLDPKQLVTLREIPFDPGWLSDVQMMTPSEHPLSPYAQ